MDSHLHQQPIRELPENDTETKKDALQAFDAFIETYGIKYDKAVECLAKDREALLTFHDFPAEHWKHLQGAIDADLRLVTEGFDTPDLKKARALLDELRA
jgi:Transposase, Mutator family